MNEGHVFWYVSSITLCWQLKLMSHFNVFNFIVLTSGGMPVRIPPAGCAGFYWASMKLNKNYIGMRDRWWALPLILPSLLLPILSTANTYAHISTGTVVLFYLPLALMISLMLFFWLGGITRNYHFHCLVQISAGWTIWNTLNNFALYSYYRA